MKIILGLLILLTGISLISINDSFAQVSTNSSFLIEGSGFAVTEDLIKSTQLDLALSTQQKSGSSIKSTIDDGFISIDDEDFIATDVKTTVLREGKFLRINGVAENIQGEEASIRFFGRLIEESKNASVYGFTGKILTNTDSYKIIYTAKFTELEKISTAESLPETLKTIKILKGASSQGIYSSYIESGVSTSVRLGYFSVDRITVEPGSSLTFVNNDTVSHRIVSGTGLGSHSSLLSSKAKICSEININLPEGFSFIPEGSEGKDCDFIFDGKINTGNIEPGGSATVTFEDRGFYRLIDPDYPWMKIDGYAFENINNLVLGQGKNLGN